MSSRDERRTYQRAGFLCRVDLTTDGGATIEANSIDISLGGAGVASPRFLAAGTPVTLAFHLRDRRGADAIERVAARVARARADPDGLTLGVEFVAPLHRSSHPLLTRVVEAL